MSAAPDPWGERLPRRLGPWSAVAVLVGITIGSGIFRVPAGVAGVLRAPAPVMLAWVLGGTVALAGALSVAELAAALPRSGGIFAFLLEAFGPLPAFLFGWSELVIIRASALGAIATIFAEYLGYFLHFSPPTVRRVAAVTILAIGALNYVGVRAAAAVMNVVTMAKFGALALLGILAFTATGAAGAGVAPLWGGALPISLIATALVPIMWTYDGWADVAFMSGEVRNPGRTLPWALVVGTVAVVAVYLLVNAAFVHLVPLAEMARSPLVAATAAERIPALGAAGGALVSGLVLVSCFGGLNGSMMVGARIFYAMADRGLFFRTVGRISPRYQTPSAAIGLATALGVVYVLLSDFQQLADRFVLGIWPFYALAVAGVYVLRRARPDLARPYRTLGYPITPAIFLLASVGMVANALLTDPVNTGVTFVIVLAGVPAFFVWRRKVRPAYPVSR